MTGHGHTNTGLLFGAFPASIAFFSFGFEYSIIAYIFCLVFSTAPDWLELQVKKNLNGVSVVTTLIPHRTITHIVFVWFLIFSLGLRTTHPSFLPDFLVNCFPILPSMLATILLGVGSGGLIHLLWDLPNKKPIPFFTLWDRVGLNLWKSGRFESQIVFMTMLLTGFLIYIFHFKNRGIDFENVLPF